ncbi:tetratricopeptide repeat protein [Pendulispora albinea]|uniref:Protein PelE n=1 Tax=Pendulispora albinea TaxID=2741071 RepID=A0ABZ2LR69_9BACT
MAKPKILRLAAGGAALAVLSALDLALMWAVLSYSAYAFGPLGFFLLLGVRAALSALGALVHLLGAPPQVAGAKRAFLPFATAMHFFVPVVGFGGMALVLRVGLGAQRAPESSGWTAFAFEGDPIGKRVTSSKRRMVSSADLEEILRSPHSSPEKRFRTVLQTRHLPLKQAIGLLKLALKDTSDEVRLFAFSRLERFRNDLETQSRELTEKLSAADVRGKPLIHLRLAEAYWEIAYLGLAEGAVLAHALQNAQDNADAACRLRPGSAPAEFLAGRIALLKREYEGAFSAFERATRAGYMRVKALPYMAECAFHQQRFDLVRTMLQEVSASGREGAQFQDVVEFWR